MFERREGLVHPKSGKPLGFERRLPSFGSSVRSLWDVYVPRTLDPEDVASAHPLCTVSDIPTGLTLTSEVRETCLR